MVQLNADYDKTNSCYTVDNTAQFSSIVVNPDILISGTSVANSISCVRRSVTTILYSCLVRIVNSISSEGLDDL